MLNNKRIYLLRDEKFEDTKELIEKLCAKVKKDKSCSASEPYLLSEKIADIEEHYTTVIEYKKLIIPLNLDEGSPDSVELSKALFECLDIKIFETDFAKHVIG